MGFRESVENNPAVWLLAALGTGFGAGFGAYRVVLETSRSDVVAHGTYTLNADISQQYILRNVYDSLQARYRTVNDSLTSALARRAASNNEKPATPRLATFPEPVYQGIRLDACYESNTRCEKEPADAWCKTKGFNRAADYKLENVGSRGIATKQIGSQAVCTASYCAAFVYIQCES